MLGIFFLKEIRGWYSTNDAERYNLEDIINSFNNDLQRLHISISGTKKYMFNGNICLTYSRE